MSRQEEGWVWVFQQKLRMIAQDKAGMKWQTLRVLLYLMSTMGFEEWVTLRQVWVARELGMETSHVSLALRRLVGCGIVKRRESVVHGTQYSLNSQYVYKGGGQGLVSRRQREMARQGGRDHLKEKV
jgi:predicted transcriptional regulator